MEEKELKKLHDAVVESIKDGRRFDSLKGALKESGYSDEDIKKITEGINPSEISRRVRKKNRRVPWLLVTILCIVFVVALYILFMQAEPQSEPEVDIKPPPQNNMIKICYASNVTIKQMMIDAGAACDKWYIVSEA
jgi:hypothetical protein